MVLEIEGNTYNGVTAPENIIEYQDVWDSVNDKWSTSLDFATFSVDKGASVLVRTDLPRSSAGFSTATAETEDILSELRKNNISFSAVLSASAADGTGGGGANTIWGSDDELYVELYDGASTTETLASVVVDVDGGTDDQAALALASVNAHFNIGVDGDTLTISSGGTTTNVDSSTVLSTTRSASSATLVADGTTVNISSWGAVKIRLRMRGEGGYNHTSFLANSIFCSPIVFSTTKFGSKKTEV